MSGSGSNVQRLELADHDLGLVDPLGLDRVPVGEVVAGALHEVLHTSRNLRWIGDGDRRQEEVAVEDADVDAHRRRDDVVPAVVRTERGERVLDQAGVERRHHRRQVDGVAEPEHRLVVRLPRLAEQQVVVVQILQPSAPGGVADGKRAVETILGHGGSPSCDGLLAPDLHGLQQVADDPFDPGVHPLAHLARLVAPHRLRTALQEVNGRPLRRRRS